MITTQVKLGEAIGAFLFIAKMRLNGIIMTHLMVQTTELLVVWLVK